MEILDLIDQEKLQRLQDLFADATGVAVSMIDKEGKHVTKVSNFLDFCMKYTRGSEIGLKRCQKCDMEGVGTYFCHAGLMDFAADIVVEGEKLGAILGGQVLPAPPDFDKFRKVAEEIGVDPDEYIEALKEVPVKTEKAIRASADLMEEMINIKSGQCGCNWGECSSASAAGAFAALDKRCCGGFGAGVYAFGRASAPCCLF